MLNSAVCSHARSQNAPLCISLLFNSQGSCTSSGNIGLQGEVYVNLRYFANKLSGCISPCFTSLQFLGCVCDRGLKKKPSSLITTFLVFQRKKSCWCWLEFAGSRVLPNISHCPCLFSFKTSLLPSPLPWHGL